MAPVSSFLTTLVVIGAALSTTVNGAAINAATQLRIMPFGASITFGQGSPAGNGYRQDLLDKLNGAGYSTDFVGSQKSGSMADRDNEGYPGLRIGEVQAKSVTTAPKYNANVYTVNLGTNDAVQDFRVDGAGERMRSALDTLWKSTPDATVILSTLIINLDATVEARIQNINKQYIALGNTLKSQGKKIITVDMRQGGPTSSEMTDKTHPNGAGYKKMGIIFFNGIQSARSAGFIK